MTIDQEKQDKIDAALQKLETTRSRLNHLGAGGQSSSAQNEYAKAYQALVRLGVKPQIKKKYRN